MSVFGIIAMACALYFVWHSIRSAFFMSHKTCHIIRFVAVGFCVGGVAVFVAPLYPADEWVADFGSATIMASMAALMKFGRRPGIDNILPAIKLPDDPDATHH